MRKIAKLAKAVLLACLAFFILVAGVLYLVQDQLIFPAPDLAIESVEFDDFTPVTISTSDDEKLFALHHPSQETEATILIFHGNADAAIYQTVKGQSLVDAGFGVLLVEYRGYPGSTGTASEIGLFIDSIAAYDFLVAQKKQQIGVYAHSLGTGVAIKLAAERDVFALVLEAPFDSLLAIVQRRFPWVPASLLLKHKFRSDLIVKDVEAPILIMHGDRDQVIPIEHGENLRRHIQSDASFVTLVGAGHNNISQFGAHNKAIEFFKGNAE